MEEEISGSMCILGFIRGLGDFEVSVMVVGEGKRFCNVGKEWGILGVSYVSLSSKGLGGGLPGGGGGL